MPSAQAAKDKRIDTALVVGGLGVVGLIAYLLSDGPEEQTANKFVDMWEVFNPDALGIATRAGVVYPYELQAIADNPGTLRTLTTVIEWLGEQAAGVVDDREDLVVAAFLRPTYAQLLMFSSMFTVRYGVPPGAFTSTFMDASSDTGPFAVIVRHIEQLRKTNARTHAGVIVSKP